MAEGAPGRRRGADADAPDDEGARASLALRGAGLWRAVSVVVLVAVATLVVTHFTYPTDAGPSQLDALTSADLVGSTFTSALVLQSFVVAALALATIIRPAMGPGVLACGALVLPWLLRYAFTPFGDGRSDGAAHLQQGAAAVVAVGVLVALVAAARRVRPEPGGIAVVDAIPLVLAVGGLWGSVGLGWYAIGTEGATFGGLLDTDAWPGRGSWLGLLLGIAVLVVAVLDGGFLRRVAGGVLAVVLGGELVLRATAGFDTLFPDIVRAPYEAAALRGVPLPVVEVEVVGLLPPLLGLVAAVWLVAGARSAPLEG